MNIVEAMDDVGLFQPWFRGRSWNNWRTILKASHALPMSDDERAFFRTIAERDPPKKRVKEAWLIAGRRSGKDSIASLVIANSSAMFDRKQGKLRRGERALVSCLATDRDQAKIVLNFTRSYFNDIPLLSQMVGRNTAIGFELSNAVDVSITTNSFRAVRGRSILAAVFDEVAYWRDEASARPDEEIYRAITPGMATIRDSMLIGISSPYRKSGLLYSKFKDHYGRDDDDVLVIRAPTKMLNPTVDQAIIDREMEKDPAAARSEWLAEWRDDISGYIDAELIEAAVDRNVVVRPPMPHTHYVSFVDPSGGQHDSFTAAVAHRERDDSVVIDCLIEVKAPCNPATATLQIASVLKTYGIHATTGDKFGSGFAVDAFARNGIKLRHTEHDRSSIYLECMPLFSSGRVRLLDNRRCVTQFVSLERRSFPTGKQVIDHGPGGHDDLCNAAAGALMLAAGRNRHFKITPEMLARASRPSSYADAYNSTGFRSMTDLVRSRWG
jgi:hypothetical protein